MRIQFVVEWLVMTGGVRVVLEHAWRLRARGHEVRLLQLSHRRPGLLGGPRLGWKRYLYEVLSGRVRDGLRSYGLESAVTTFDPEALETVPAADVTVATAWITAEWVASMPDRVGTKFYLVQQYEAWTDDIRPRVDATWKLPLRKIVIARWLERLARERFGEAVLLIPNGVDPARFRPPRGRNHGSPVVGMAYELQPWKGLDDGLAALEAVSRAAPQTRFLLFGRSRPRHPLPPRSRYVQEPHQDHLPGIYGAIDVFVNPSHSEGFSLLILEAMACGCATVATAVGEVPEMGRPGVDYYMVPPRDPSAIAEAVLTLLRDPDRRAEVAEAGRRLALTYSWERATDLLEDALIHPQAVWGQ